MLQENTLIFAGQACLLLMLLACLALQACTLIKMGRDSNSSRFSVEFASAFERFSSQSVESNRQSHAELRQELRTAIAEGTAESLQAAFKLVNEGTSATAAELVRFGQALKEDVGLVRSDVATIADRISSAVIAVNSMLGERLSAAETWAAEGRAVLLHDTTGAILHSREQTDSSLKRFGEEQEGRLQALEKLIKDRGIAAETVSELFRTSLLERVDFAGRATEGALKTSVSSTG